jgi:hypothetical protein
MIHCNISHAQVHPIWDPSDVSYLLANNKRWVHNKTQEDPDFFKRQALGHHPEYLFIGCSDARLSVQNMLGLEVHTAHSGKKNYLVFFRVSLSCQ